MSEMASPQDCDEKPAEIPAVIEPTHKIDQPDAADTAPPVGPRPCRRVRRVVWLILILGVLSLVGRYSYLRITRRPTPRPDYWIARLAEDRRQKGPWPTRPWDDAAQILATLPWRPTKISIPPNLPYLVISDALKGTWDLRREDVAFVDQHVQSVEFKTARDTLAAAVVDGWQEPVNLPFLWHAPSTREYYVWHNWLLADARRAIAVEGDWQQASTDWLTCCRLARQSVQHRYLWPISSAIGILENTAWEMQLAATEGRVDVETLALAIQIDSIVGPVEKPSRLFSSQRLFNLYQVDNCYVADGGWLDVSASVAFYNGGAEPSRLWNVTAFLFDRAETCTQKIDAYFAEMDEVRTLVDCWERGIDKTRVPDASQPSVVDGVRGFYQEYPARLIDDYYLAHMSMDAAVTMLALSSFRQTHGEYPERLELLVPDYLPRLPIDRADLQTLRYRREGDAYQLYSLGPDGRDDFAAPLGENWMQAQRVPQGDIVYSGPKRKGS